MTVAMVFMASVSGLVVFGISFTIVFCVRRIIKKKMLGLTGCQNTCQCKWCRRSRATRRIDMQQQHTITTTLHSEPTTSTLRPSKRKKFGFDSQVDSAIGHSEQRDTVIDMEMA